VKGLVVKVGTGTLTGADGRFDSENCDRLGAELAEAARARRVVLVTSGAITVGAQKLGLVRSRARPWDIATKQACAAVGQPDLVEAWGHALAPHGIMVAQVLLTAEDLANRKRFLNARRTFARLLELGVLPVVNENDTVAVEEIKVGDNDSLAALVATCVEAELVAMLTDVEGLYDRNPAEKGATLLSDVERVTADIERMAGGAGANAASAAWSPRCGPRSGSPRRGWGRRSSPGGARARSPSSSPERGSAPTSRPSRSGSRGARAGSPRPRRGRASSWWTRAPARRSSTRGGASFRQA